MKIHFFFQNDSTSTTVNNIVVENFFSEVE